MQNMGGMQRARRLATQRTPKAREVRICRASATGSRAQSFHRDVRPPASRARTVARRAASVLLGRHATTSCRQRSAKSTQTLDVWPPRGELRHRCTGPAAVQMRLEQRLASGRRTHGTGCATHAMRHGCHWPLRFSTRSRAAASYSLATATRDINTLRWHTSCTPAGGLSGLQAIDSAFATRTASGRCLACARQARRP